MSSTSCTRQKATAAKARIILISLSMEVQLPMLGRETIKMRTLTHMLTVALTRTRVETSPGEATNSITSV